MNSYSRTEDEEIMDYIKRCKTLKDEDVLKYLGDMRDFFYKYRIDEHPKKSEELEKKISEND